jgi:nitronate monooxygenase
MPAPPPRHTRLATVARNFPRLQHPIVQAPMAGGPSTPALAAAVSAAGGLGFLAAGYKSPDELRADIAATRALTSAPVGVNMFVLAETPVDRARLAAYATAIEPEARRHGVALGEPRFEDDSLDAKLEIVCRERPLISSFTFGCPTPEVIERLHERDIAVWVTVTEVDEALLATQAGADALVAQGVEAGGHRGSFEDAEGRGEIALLPLLRLLAGAGELPLVATGGIADGAAVAAVLVAGARAAQIGTAFMRCPEAATSAPHREALTRSGPTALTRAFSGRRARGILNAFMRDHGAHAPPAYPHVHHLTAPLRAVARRAGDADAINLWAGQAYPLAEDRPAGELVRRWSADARVAIEQAGVGLTAAGEHPG